MDSLAVFFKSNLSISRDIFAQVCSSIRWGIVALNFFALLSIAGILIKNFAPLDLDLSAEAWAAWVQAIGSIIAIFIAIAVPVWQRRADALEKRREAFIRARSLGNVLLREFEIFQKRIDKDIDIAQRAGAHEIVRVSEKTIPQALWDSAQELHVLGRAGNFGISAIYAVHRARENLMQPAMLAPSSRQEFIEHMATASMACARAISGIRDILH